MLNERENVLKALREKPLKVHEVMRRANIPKEEACQALLLKMRGEGSLSSWGRGRPARPGTRSGTGHAAATRRATYESESGIKIGVNQV